MKKLITFIAILFSLLAQAQAPTLNQYGTRTPKLEPYPTSAKSIDVNSGLSVNSTTAGFVPPRMTTTQKLAISSPVAGTLVYDSTIGGYQLFNGTTWVAVGGSTATVPPLQEVVDEGNAVIDNTIILSDSSTGNSATVTCNGIITNFLSSDKTTYYSTTGIQTNLSGANVTINYPVPSGIGMINFPDVGNDTKTVAYVEDMSSGYVPYTGASSNVDLNGYELRSDVIRPTNIQAEGIGGGGFIEIPSQSAPPTAGSFGVRYYTNNQGYPEFKDTSNRVISFSTNGLTTPRQFDMPNADGTILLNDNTATVTNKTIPAGSNTITGISNTNISSGAAIDATKINTGVVSNTEFNYLDGVTSSIQSQIDGKQTSDSDLTDIAALSPPNDNLLQRKAGAWTSRTPAQVKSDLALTSADVGLGSVPNIDATNPANISQTSSYRFVTDTEKSTWNNSVKIIAKNTSNPSITGTTTETIFDSYLVTGGTLSSVNTLQAFYRYRKTGTAGQSTIKIYINTTNSLSGATQIATSTTANTNLWVLMERTYSLTGGLLYGYPFSSSVISDVTGAGIALSSMSLNPANNFYIIITGQLGNSADTITLDLFKATN